MDAHLLSSVRSALDEVENGHIFHRSIQSLAAYLGELWDPQPILREQAAEWPIECAPGAFMPAPVPRRSPPWYVGMSSGFLKDVLKIDRKLQGRILEALTDLAKNPLETKGDTIKPLSGELKGCWRYRIADHRLIYSPDRETGNVTLLAFAPRGSAYER